jgi:aminotransferase
MREKLAERAKSVQQSSIRAMTRKIEAVGGVNLGQGTCPLPPHPAILRAAQDAIEAGHNSYTLFDGIPSLKAALTEKYSRHNNINIDLDNVLVTSGATGGLECICKCFLEPGDEVVLIAPMYQYHVSQVVERAAVPRFLRLREPDWTIDPDDLEAVFSEKTKLFVFANPNNPCGKVFRREELEMIGEVCRRRGVVMVCDEVYEYLLREDREHISLASLPGMFDHTITISSASKTFFVTGWRVGWLIAPHEVMDALGVRSDETYVCAPAPFQHAVAEALRMDDDFFEQIRVPFHRRRNLVLDALRAAGLRPQSPEGAYYILADYTGLGFHDDLEATLALIEQARVASVPGSAFYPKQPGETPPKTGLLRFGFALPDELIERGCELLVRNSLRLQER